MLTIKRQPDDNDQFISRVEVLIEKFILDKKPNSFYLIKIDNWFDKKWLKFTGKLLGAFGVSTNDLRIPPFVPNRVAYEKFYSKNLETELYEISKTNRKIHIVQNSESNFNRKIRTLIPETAFVWYSGNSKNNKRGTVMIYLPIDDEYISLHLELEAPEWDVKNSTGVSKKMLNSVFS
ncbi:MAG: hypothetical protein ROO71_05900 [Balneola sp.]